MWAQEQNPGTLETEDSNITHSASVPAFIGYDNKYYYIIRG